MVDRRKKDVNWAIAEEDGHVPDWERVNTALLMDLRDELKLINGKLFRLERLFTCPNFMDIPRLLSRISRNTAKPKKVKQP